MTSVVVNHQPHQVHPHNAPIKLSEARLPKSQGLLDLGDRVSFFGVELFKGAGGPRTPDVKRFEKEVLTAWDLELMQKIAVGLRLNQPILLEGGSGIGKSSTVDMICPLS